jgi:hypothetical protein
VFFVGVGGFARTFLNLESEFAPTGVWGVYTLLVEGCREGDQGG